MPLSNFLSEFFFVSLASHIRDALLPSQQTKLNHLNVLTFLHRMYRAGNTNVAEVHGTVERVVCKTHGVFTMPTTPNHEEAAKVR